MVAQEIARKETQFSGFHFASLDLQRSTAIVATDCKPPCSSRELPLLSKVVFNYQNSSLPLQCCYTRNQRQFLGMVCNIFLLGKDDTSGSAGHDLRCI